MKSEKILVGAFFFAVMGASIAQGQPTISIAVKKDGKVSSEQKKQIATVLYPKAFHSHTGQTVETVLRSSGQYTTFLSLVERAGLMPLLDGTLQDTTYVAVNFVDGSFDDVQQIGAGDMQLSGSGGSAGIPANVDVTSLKSQMMDQFSSVLTDAAKYALAQDGQVTVFAPTNTAFSKLPDATRKALTRDSASAATFVRPYLVNKGVYAQGFSKIVSLESLAGTELKIGKGALGNATINGVAVAGSELVGDNGVVHGLADLLPSDTKSPSTSPTSHPQP